MAEQLDDGEHRTAGAATLRGQLPQPARPWRWLAGLVLLGLALGTVYLGRAPLGGHEALAAERTRELMDHGWVFPYLNGEPDFTKPPLAFWVGGAVALAAGGVQEWTARLPSVLATVGLMILLVLWVRDLAGWRAGLVTGLCFITSYSALYWGRRAEVDMQLAFWAAAALTLYWRMVKAATGRATAVTFVLMAICLAATFLAKGPLALPPLGLAALAMTAMNWHRWRRTMLLPILACLAGALLAMPWFLTAMHIKPDLLTLFYQQSVGRALGEIRHEKPFYYYLTYLPLMVLPWIFFVALGIHLAWKKRLLSRETFVYLLAWAVGTVIFMSFSTGKRPQYILPTIPPFIIFAGLGLDYVLFVYRGSLRTTAARLAIWGHAIFIPGALIGGAVGAMVLQRREGWPVAMACLAAGLVAFVGLLLAARLFASERRAAALVTFALTILGLQAIAAGALVPPLLKDRAKGEVGRYIHDHVPAGANVRAYAELSPETVFYAARLVPIIESPAQLAEWRQRNPGGYLVLKDRRSLPEVQPFGPWREVEFTPPQLKVTKDAPLLLQVAPVP